MEKQTMQDRRATIVQLTENFLKNSASLQEMLTHFSTGIVLVLSLLTDKESSALVGHLCSEEHEKLMRKAIEDARKIRENHMT